MDRSGRHDRRVAVYWPCQSGEDQQLLLWPDQRHLVWHYFLSDSAVCQPAITGVFLCREYLRLVCVVATNQSERGRVENSLVAIAEGTQLVGGLRCSDWSDDGIYQSGVCILTRVAVMIMQALGLQVVMPELQPDAFPFWDSCMMVLSIVAMILMTRKYVENWLLWVIINVISVVIFALQGVYAMSLEYIILTFIALNGSRMWINSARERGSRALSH